MSKAYAWQLDGRIRVLTNMNNGENRSCMNLSPNTEPNHLSTFGFWNFKMITQNP